MKPEENIQALKDLYRDRFFIRLFAAWRCWHTPYAFMERFMPREGLIIDLGCGYGFFSNLLSLTCAKREIIGIDISEQKLKSARRGLAGVRFQKADVREFNFMPTQAFTLIHLLHHLSSFREQEELLKRCYENLTAGGILLVLEIDKRPLWKFGFSAILDNLAYPGHKFYFRNRGELNSILKAAGFRAIRTFPLHRGVPLSHILYVAQK